MFGFRVGFSGSADLMVQLSKFKNPRWRLAAILDIQNGHNLSTALPIDLTFGFRVGFPAELSFYQRVSIAHSGIVSKRRKLAS